MSEILDYITSSAVSLTVSGNTGISPFLTLFLMGVVEKFDPTLLNMEGTWIEPVLSSWFSIAVLGILTGLEFLGKCIPVIDEFIDSIEVFVVPVLSVFGTSGTLGLLDLAQAASAAAAAGEGGRRLLVGDTGLTVIKVILVVVGIVLSLLIHLFKMLVRLIGLTCCAGCCQPCITVVEVTMVLCGVLLSIFVREIAIVTCVFILCAAGFAIHRKFMSKKDDGDEGDSNAAAAATGAITTTTTNGGTTTTTTTITTIEAPPMAQATAIAVDGKNDVENPSTEVVASIEGNLPPPIPPPTADIPEAEAKAY